MHSTLPTGKGKVFKAHGGPAQELLKPLSSCSSSGNSLPSAHHFSSLLSLPMFLCTFWLLILAESPSLPMDTHIPGKLLFSSYLPHSDVNLLCEDFPLFELIIPFSKLLEPLVYFNTHHMILSSSLSTCQSHSRHSFWGWGGYAWNIEAGKLKL